MAIGAAGAAVIGAGAGLVGTVLTNQAAARQAQNQMDFQARMSSTAHQREVKDLRAAGLNPMLSVNAGASTPSGAMADVENAIGAGVSTAMQIKELQSRLDVNEATKAAQLASAARDTSNAKQANAQTKLLEINSPAIAAEARLRTLEATTDSKYFKARKLNQYLQEGLGTVNSAKDLLNPFLGRPSKIPKLPKDHSIINEKTGEIFKP